MITITCFDPAQRERMEEAIAAFCEHNGCDPKTLSWAENGTSNCFDRNGLPITPYRVFYWLFRYSGYVPYEEEEGV
jgi:hypothetical protein